MSDTALIVPVPRVAPLISPWASRYDASTVRGIPPHVTILFPFLPSEEITADDLAALAGLFRGVPSFTSEFIRVGRFEDGEVLHLVPEPAEPFRRMMRDVRTRWPDLRPYAGRHEDPAPHVTVGTHMPRHEARQAARSLLLSVPIRFPVGVVQLWGGNEHDGWQALRSFPLYRVP